MNAMIIKRDGGAVFGIDLRDVRAIHSNEGIVDFRLRDGGRVQPIGLRLTSDEVDEMFSRWRTGTNQE